jgi:hypothetical protein
MAGCCRRPKSRETPNEDLALAGSGFPVAIWCGLLDEFRTVTGAPLTGEALVASDEARSGLHPLGFDPSRIRPEVLAFAALMETKLRENDHKGGWKQDEPIALVKRVEQETNELRRAVNNLDVIVWADDAYRARAGNGWSRLKSRYSRAPGRRRLQAAGRRRADEEAHRDRS